MPINVGLYDTLILVDGSKVKMLELRLDADSAFVRLGQGYQGCLERATPESLSSLEYKINSYRKSNGWSEWQCVSFGYAGRDGWVKATEVR